MILQNETLAQTWETEGIHAYSDNAIWFAFKWADHMEERISEQSTENEQASIDGLQHDMIDVTLQKMVQLVPPVDRDAILEEAIHLLRTYWYYEPNFTTWVTARSEPKNEVETQELNAQERKQLAFFRAFYNIAWSQDFVSSDYIYEWKQQAAAKVGMTDKDLERIYD